EGAEADQRPQHAGAGPQRRGPEHGHRHQRRDGAGAAGRWGPVDLHPVRRLGGRGGGHVVTGFPNRPDGRNASTARNTRGPGSTPQPGESWAPRGWAPPSTIPPASVPHKDPSPPMMTASKAKISRVGPSAGEKVVRMPRKIPAMATVARARPVATAKAGRVSRR